MQFDDLISRGLSFDKLRTFLAVVRAGSVVAAAEGNRSRRSLMSRQLNELEATLGFDLFSRIGKRLVLTDAGRRIALVAASFADELVAAISEIEGRTSVVRIGAGSSTLETIVFPKLPSLPKEFGGIQFEFEFESDSTDGLLRALQEGKLAMAIVRIDAVTEAHLSFPLGEMDFTMVARRDFARGIETWSVKQIVERAPLAMIGGTGSLVRKFSQICDGWGLSPAIQYRVDTFGHVQELLDSGCPAGLLPVTLAKRLPREGFVAVHAEELAGLTRRFALIIDKRVARTRDALKSTAGRLAMVFG